VRVAPLFSLLVTHEYYDGPCPDIEFVLNAASDHIARGGRLMLRQSPGKLDVMFERAGDDDPLVSIAGARLRVALRLTNPAFRSFTDPTTFAASRVLRFDNTKVARRLDPVQIPPEGVTVDPELAPLAVIAIADITIAAAFYDNPAEFEIAFSARDEKLSYYVVARNYSPADLNALTVQDAGFGDDGRAEIAFTRINAAGFTDTELPRSSLGDDSAHVVLFRSTDPVPRVRRARRRIQLLRNTKPIIDNLPQPAPDSPSANVIVHVSKPKP
jgi:hypothetical protein